MMDVLEDLVLERAELFIKIQRCAYAINYDASISPTHIGLMHLQLEAMTNYERALKARITDLEVKVMVKLNEVMLAE